MEEPLDGDADSAARAGMDVGRVVDMAVGKAEDMVVGMGEDMEEDEPEEVTRIFETGELLEDTPTLTAAEWEAAYGDIAEKDIDKVVYAFIKWDDLGYDESMFSGSSADSAADLCDCSILGLASTPRRTWIRCLRPSFQTFPALEDGAGTEKKAR